MDKIWDYVEKLGEDNMLGERVWEGIAVFLLIYGVWFVGAFVLLRAVVKLFLLPFGL